MQENIKEDHLLKQMINSTRYFLYYLGKKWWALLLAVLTGAGLGVLYYQKQTPQYKAVCTFILEEKSAGGGGLSGLASQFGVSLGNLAGGSSIFAGDNILDILKSKKVVKEVLMSPVDEQAAAGQTLADLYLDFTGTKEKWQQKPSLANITFHHGPGELTPLQDSVLNVVYENIVKRNLVTERTSKQGTIILVKVVVANSMFARLFTERLVAEASKLYLNIRVGTAQANILQLQKRSDSLLVLLNNKSYRAAASQPLDINPGIRTANVPVEIATRDKTVLSTVYAEVIKNLEASRVLLSQQMPVIQLLDRPGQLLNDERKSLLFFLLVGSLVAAFCFVLAAFGAFCLQK